jgi:hypothetical protein
VVLSRADDVLLIDQVLGSPSRQSRTARIVISSRTHIGGRRNAAAAIRIGDLVRADGVASPDGSLEALYLEVVLTVEEISMGRPVATGTSGLLWQWILHGSLTIPLR